MNRMSLKEIKELQEKIIEVEKKANRDVWGIRHKIHELKMQLPRIYYYEPNVNGVGCCFAGTEDEVMDYIENTLKLVHENLRDFSPTVAEVYRNEIDKANNQGVGFFRIVTKIDGRWNHANILLERQSQSD